MAKVMLEVSLVWVLMYQNSKSTFFQVILNFELEQMDINSRNSNSNFAHSFDFHCLTNFAKGINLSWMVSLKWKLLCKCSIYTLKSDQWITIWWAKFELECLLLVSIYFNSTFKVTCKNGENIRCALKIVHSNTKKAKSGVRQSQVSVLHTTHSCALMFKREKRVPVMLNICR